MEEVKGMQVGSDLGRVVLGAHTISDCARHTSRTTSSGMFMSSERLVMRLLLFRVVLEGAVASPVRARLGTRRCDSLSTMCSVSRLRQLEGPEPELKRDYIPPTLPGWCSGMAG